MAVSTISEPKHGSVSKCRICTCTHVFSCFSRGSAATSAPEETHPHAHTAWPRTRQSTHVRGPAEWTHVCCARATTATARSSRAVWVRWHSPDPFVSGTADSLDALPRRFLSPLSPSPPTAHVSNFSEPSSRYSQGALAWCNLPESVTAALVPTPSSQVPPRGTICCFRTKISSSHQRRPQRPLGCLRKEIRVAFVRSLTCRTWEWQHPWAPCVAYNPSATQPPRG